MKQEGIEPIILEVCRWGAGLDSFLSFFDEQTFFLVYLQHVDSTQVEIKNPYAFTKNGLNVLLDGPPYDLTVDLSNSDCFNDRVVPHFHYCRWKIVDPLKFRLSPHVDVILEKLKCFVDNNNAL
jgi:hypothetical protein